MKIAINEQDKNIFVKNSFLLDKSNINRLMLPSFTKKIFNSLPNL